VRPLLHVQQPGILVGELNSRLSSLTGTLLLLIVLGPLLAASVMAQQSNSTPVDSKTIHTRIEEIVRATLKAGEGRILHNGQVINTYTRSPPTSEHVEEVKRFGDDAVPVLEQYLSSDIAPEYELAMRFLGALGGSRIVDPLRKIILLDPSARKREYAVRAITQAPWDEASEILRYSAASDPDPQVRGLAREMLQGYARQ
jgi:hypothetical protein